MDAIKLELMLEQAATRALEKQAAGPQSHVCRFEDMTPEQHRRHHELIDSAMEFLARLNNTKWGVIKAVAVCLVIGAIGIFCVGLTKKFGGP